MNPPPKALDKATVEALERAARAATPGPWEVDSIPVDGEYGVGEDASSDWFEFGLYTAAGHLIASTECRAHEITEIAEVHDDEGYVHAWNEPSKRDATFIAAANPQTVLALTAAWRDAQMLADQNTFAFNHNKDLGASNDELRLKVHRLERALRGLLVLRENTDMTHEDAYDAMFKSVGDVAWDAATAALRGGSQHD